MAVTNESKALAETPMERQRAERLHRQADESFVNQDKLARLENNCLRNSSPKKRERTTMKTKNILLIGILAPFGRWTPRSRAVQCRLAPR